MTLLRRNTVAGAVARAIEYQTARDMELVYAHCALFLGDADHVTAYELTLIERACAANKADRVRMNSCACLQEAGATPSDRVMHLGGS